MTLSFLFRTDVHVADKNPESWKADYMAEVWSNLEQIGSLAKKYSVTAVLDGGDYFHVKASTRNSHFLVARSAEIQASYPCPTYGVVGNHDMAHNNLSTLERQPLQVLFASGTFHRLDEAFFTKGGKKVRVVGCHYSPTRTLEELRAIKKKDEDYLIAVVHALAGEDPPAQIEEFFGEPVFRYGDLISKDGPDCWNFGHWHKDQGVTKIGEKYFISPGAVSRGALVKENLTRVPQVALIEIGTSVSVGLVQLKVPSAQDVFDLERKERREQESDNIGRLVESIRQSVGKVSLDNEADVSAAINQLDFAAQVRTRALEYLEKAREEA